MSLREQTIEYLRQVFGCKNALDLLAEGLDDPNFDPDKPYRGSPKKPEPFEESEQASMLLDMMVYALETMTWIGERTFEDAYIVSKMRLAPAQQVFNIVVAVP
jgi:hypothetical protein